MIAEDGGFAVADEGELAGFHGIACVTGLLFGHADGADLWFAVGGVGNAQLVDGVRGLAGNVGDGDDALHHSGVRELRQAGDNVPDGVEAGLGGFHELIDVDEAALDFGFGFFEAAIFGHGFATDGEQKFFGLKRLRFTVLVLERDGDALGVFLYAIPHSACLAVYALFL